MRGECCAMCRFLVPFCCYDRAGRHRDMTTRRSMASSARVFILTAVRMSAVVSRRSFSPMKGLSMYSLK